MNYTSKETYEYISLITNDPIVERKICAVSGNEFAVYQSDLDFYAKISPSFGGEKFAIATPTLCPEERQRRRMSFRNERKLYRRKCDASGKDIISMYSPDKPYKVYDPTIWWSDSWDPMSYGRDFDFTKSFTQQFKELQVAVPRASLINVTNENSDYTNFTANSKNCFMCSTTAFSEDMIYVASGWYSQKCVDSIDLVRSNNCYECINVSNSSHLLYSQNCDSCHYSQYLYDCSGCSYCYNCSNLHNKTYCISNVQYSKEDYEKVLTSGVIREQLAKINSACNLVACENVYGDSIKNSSNSTFCFNGNEGINIKHGFNYSNIDDCMDCSCFGFNSNLDYEIIAGEDLVKCMALYATTHITNGYYVDSCFHNNNIFGCIGLRNKEYCILNKQYTKEEYESLVGKIIRHMQTTGERGEFLHPSLSPFGYNETVAQEYYPLTNSQLQIINSKLNHIENGELRIENGYSWSDYSSDPVIPSDIQTIDFRKTEWGLESENYKKLNEVRDYVTWMDLAKQILICEVSGRPFRLQKSELEFYHKHLIAIPRKHPDIRHQERLNLRPGRTLFLRSCDKCKKEMLSVYPVSSYDNESKKVFCDECYRQEVYG